MIITNSTIFINGKLLLLTVNIFIKGKLLFLTVNNYINGKFFSLTVNNYYKLNNFIYDKWYSLADLYKDEDDIVVYACDHSFLNSWDVHHNQVELRKHENLVF